MNLNDNVPKKGTDQRTFGERVADKVAEVVGSWPFIITQSIILTIWIILNVIAIISHWDPYPFILLNLMLSFQAAYTGPVVMMSQNRQSAIDRAIIQHDFELDQHTNKEMLDMIAEVRENQIMIQKNQELLQQLVDHMHKEQEAAIQQFLPPQE